MTEQEKPTGAPAGALEDVRATLAARIARWTAAGDSPVAVTPALTFFRREAPSEPASCLYPPSLALIVQGAKRVRLGSDAYIYDARRFLITSLDLPVVADVIEATPRTPYLGLALKLDLRMVTELMVDGSLPPPREQPACRGMVLGQATRPLLDAVLRLVDLLDTPDDLPVLAPLIEREIVYRLLTGDQGARLRQIASVGSQSHRIARAIDWLKAHYARPLRVDDLAAHVQMSASSFHHHFRALTAMSPLQFQKWLRLTEARRLMLAERLEASTAAFRVGYESPSQFSREYSRLFGAPPARDVAGLRQETGAAAVIGA